MATSPSSLLKSWQSAPKGLRRSLAGIATNRLARAAVLRATSGRLRVLAYHGVDDLERFERGVAQIVADYVPVSAEEVAASILGSTSLPLRAVWFTFDDGLKSTFDAAEMLAGHGVRATVFVNPASMDAPALQWFQVHDLATRRGLIAADEQDRFAMRRLKTVPDEARRKEVAELAERLAALPDVPVSLSGRLEDVERWVRLGHDVGNHTWDHPCLDQCTPIQQREQIERAHTWLLAIGLQPRFFAYPNGDWSSEAAAVARELGYAGSVLFDHRLANVAGDPQRISRLRIDASADPRRVAGVVSGAHSAAFGALRLS